MSEHGPTVGGLKATDSLFEPLPWLDQVFSDLTLQSKEGRFPHALLVEGGEGSGKLALARALAAYLLCAHRSQQSRACGKCKHCELMLADSHGDYREIMPEEGAKQIKIDAIRRLSEFVSASSLLGGSKVVVLSPIAAMNISAANALLKTLEEPAGDTVLILLSHSGEAVMPTIRSRCQTLKPPLPSRAQLFDWLNQKGAISEQDFDRLEAMAPGAPLKMQAYLESGMLAELDTMFESLSAVLKRECTVTEVAEHWASDQPIQRMQWLSQWLQEIARLGLTGDETAIVHPAARKMFAYLASRHSVLNLCDVYQDSVLALGHLRASNNLNPLLIFEQLLGTLLGLMSSKTKVSQV